MEIELKARSTAFGISFLSLCNISRYFLISAYMYRLYTYHCLSPSPVSTNSGEFFKRLSVLFNTDMYVYIN